MTATIEHSNRFQPPGISYRLEPAGSLRRRLRPRLDPEQAVESDDRTETGILENESEAEAQAREERDRLVREENQRRQEAAQRAEAAAQQREEARRRAELRAANPSRGPGDEDPVYHELPPWTLDGRVIRSSLSRDGTVRYTFEDGTTETYDRDRHGDVRRESGDLVEPTRWRPSVSFSGPAAVSSVETIEPAESQQTRAELGRSFMEDGLTRTKTGGDPESGLLESTSLGEAIPQETGPTADHVPDEQAATPSPTAFTGQVIVNDGQNPVEYANQQVAEANAAAGDVKAAEDKAELAFSPYTGEPLYFPALANKVLKSLEITDNPDGSKTYSYTDHKGLRHTSDHPGAYMAVREDAEAQDAENAAAGDLGLPDDFSDHIGAFKPPPGSNQSFREIYTAELTKVNQAGQSLEDAVAAIGAKRQSGGEVYADSPEWQTYLSAKSGYDQTLEDAVKSLNLTRKSGDTAFDALKSYVSGVNEKLAASGHQEAYAKWEKEYAEAVKAAEGWQPTLTATAGTSAEGVGYTMSEGVAPATHRLVETPQGLPSLVVPINPEAQPAEGVGHTMSEGPAELPPLSSAAADTSPPEAPGDRQPAAQRGPDGQLLQKPGEFQRAVPVPAREPGKQ